MPKFLANRDVLDAHVDKINVVSKSVIVVIVRDHNGRHAMRLGSSYLLFDRSNFCHKSRSKDNASQCFWPWCPPYGQG
uniref:ADP-ribose pyrophosphatase n=1 Tax=Globodera pallida TaxID=36090 RepID=A0A183CJ08_GLOPA